MVSRLILVVLVLSHRFFAVERCTSYRRSPSLYLLLPLTQKTWSVTGQRYFIVVISSLLFRLLCCIQGHADVVGAQTVTLLFAAALMFTVRASVLAGLLHVQSLRNTETITGYLFMFSQLQSACLKRLQSVLFLGLGSGFLLLSLDLSPVTGSWNPPPVSTCPLRGFFFTDSETEEDLMGNCDGVWLVQIPRWHMKSLNWWRRTFGWWCCVSILRLPTTPQCHSVRNTSPDVTDDITFPDRCWHAGLKPQGRVDGGFLLCRRGNGRIVSAQREKMWRAHECASKKWRFIHHRGRGKRK